MNKPKPDTAGAQAPTRGAMEACRSERADAAELVARARAMIPALAERALEQKRRRAILPETISEMQRAGFFRVLQPRRWGGYEMDLGTFYEIEMALAQGDMSTGWTYGVIGVVSWFLGLMDDRAAREVWAQDRAVLVGSSTMPAGKAQPVEGGFRLAGHWRYASGCDHCGWTVLGGMVEAENAPPDWTFFLVSRRDYRTVDNWEVAGLQGTGSIDIIVDDVFVPAFRTQRLADNFNLEGEGQAVNTGSLYRIPFGQIFVRGVSISGIGALAAMLEALIAHSRTRVSRAGGRAAENALVHLLCAESSAAIDEMRATLHRNFATLTAYAGRAETPPLDLRLQYKFQSSAVIERCTLLAARIFKAAGAAGLSDHLPFGRILADLMAARAHISNQYEVYGSNWGGAMLGLPNKDLLL